LDRSHFDETDLRGTYVFGEPDILQLYLSKKNDPLFDTAAEKAESGLRQRLLAIGAFFKRNAKEEDDLKCAEVKQNANQEPVSESEPKQGSFQKFRTRIAAFLEPEGGVR